jgi:GNAT superfamily N-acetyltransferase
MLAHHGRRRGGVAHEIILTDAPDPAARDALLQALLAHNVALCGPHGMRPLAALVRDDAGTVAGGLWGRTSWDWLFVELLFLPEALRGGGLGAELLRRAEEEAMRRGCVGVWLDTFSAQARGFYERQGYEVFGTLDGYPAGHGRFFLRKALARANPTALRAG